MERHLIAEINDRAGKFFRPDNFSNFTPKIGRIQQYSRWITLFLVTFNVMACKQWFKYRLGGCPLSAESRNETTAITMGDRGCG
jgi:hypothetical protein